MIAPEDSTRALTVSERAVLIRALASLPQSEAAIETVVRDPITRIASVRRL